MPETVMLPHQVRSALLRAETFDPADNSIEVVWTTGAAVTRSDWDGTYVETLDVTPKAVRLDRLNAGASFLDSHSSYRLASILGGVVPGSAKIQGGEGVCRVALSTDPAKAGVVGDIRAKIIRNVSVGYIVHAVIRTEGKDGAAATCRVTDWEPFEISAVAVPADPGAQVRSDPAVAEPTYPCLVERAESAAGADAAPVPAAADPATEARTAETARVQGILKVARQLDVPSALADTAIAGNTTLDAFRALAIDARGSGPALTGPVVPAVEALPASTHAARAAATEEATMDPENVSPAVETRAAPAVALAPAAPVDLTAVRAQETSRIQGILVAARKLGLGAEIADKAIADNVSLERFHIEAIDAAAVRSSRDAPFTPNGAASEPAHRTYAAPKAEMPKGTNATRIMIALAAARGSRRDAADFAERHYGPEGALVSRALGTSVGSAGGFLVPPEMSAEVIELLRPASTVMALEPNILPMPSGNLMIPRIQSGANAGYVGENQPTQGSQETFSMVQLSAKKLTSIVPISNDMIRFPAVSTDAIVRSDMVLSIAMRADLAFLRGNGTQFSPRGLKSFAAAPILAGANTLAASVLVGTTYASASQSNAITALASVTLDLSRLELALENANVKMTRPGWVMSPRSKSYLMNIRDGLGNQVYYAEMSKGMLRGKPFKITTQIPNNLAALASDGVTATTDGSEIYLADFAEVFIGEAYGLELDVFPGGTYVDSNGSTVSGISSDQTVMRAIVQHDMAMRQEAAVAILTGVRWF